MLDCHSTNEDMFFAFLQTDGADLSASLLFSVNFKNLHPIFQVYIATCSFYSSRRKCTERLGASLHAFITFRAKSKAIQGRILKFLSGCGEGDQAFVERVLEGTPPPKSHAPCDLPVTVDNA